MECRDVQKLFIPFINDALGAKELKGFLRHMEACADCREEYEIYYTAIMGTRYLEDTSIKADEWVEPMEKLRLAQEYLHQCRILRAEKLALFGILCIGVMLLLF